MSPTAKAIDFPAWDQERPEPHLLTGSKTFLLFYKQRSASEEVVIAEFDDCIGVRIGPPSDSTLWSHPLWGKGLKYYAAHEVEDSAWKNEVSHIERHRSSPGWIAAYRHFVFTFHNETVECLARGFQTSEYTGSMAGALALIAKSVGAREAS